MKSSIENVLFLLDLRSSRLYLADFARGEVASGESAAAMVAAAGNREQRQRRTYS
jgi:hypothetical protein